MKTLFEAQFNGNKNLICRTFAKNKKEAIKGFKEIYPKFAVTKIYEP
jgi:hypothetical protein